MIDATQLIKRVLTLRVINKDDIYELLGISDDQIDDITNRINESDISYGDNYDTLVLPGQFFYFVQLAGVITADEAMELSRFLDERDVVVSLGC